MTDTLITTKETFKRATEQALESITTEQPQTVEPLGQGNRKRTVLVRFDDRSPVVVQLCTEGTWLRTESTLLAQIRERTTVPVPPVLTAGLVEGVAFMVTPYLPGEDLHETFTTFDPETKQRISRTFGRHLGTLHRTFRFDSCGTLVVDNGELTGQCDDFQEWLLQYGQRAIATLPEEFDPIREELVALFTDPPVESLPTLRLFPWDFRPGNAVADDGQIRAILDWEAPIAATPALSVAKAKHLVADWYAADPAPLRAAFVAGYEEVREYPDVRPIHRVTAIADSAVDSNGTVTNPGYPEVDRETAVEFHRERLVALL